MLSDNVRSNADLYMPTGSINLSEESNSDNDSNWQVAVGKRKNDGSPKVYHKKRPHIDDGPSTSNRYAALATEDIEDDNNNSTAVPKPPPIFIPNVENIAKMVTSINKVISSTDYHYKSLRDGQVRLVVNKVESYRTLIKHLDMVKIIYHTFQLKQERAFRVVIKGLHHSTSISDIKAFLLSLGHQVRSVRNVVSRVSKQPLPMFFVDIDPKENNKEVYNIHSFDNAIVTIEAPKKYEDIVQCHRCQDFGHTKSYCRRNFRCVKCGLGHSTAECTKLANTPPKCVHCSSNHTANYRGCTAYQKLIHSKSINKNRNTQDSPNHDFRRPSLHFNNNQNVTENNTWTYAQTIKGDQNGANTILEKIEAMIEKQIQLTNTMMNMMTMIMNKLCK